MEDEFTRKLREQIKKNNESIAEAKRTMERMRTFFRSLGADLDSGHNIFLDSPLIDEEDRRQTKAIIEKMEEELEAQYQEYKKSTMEIPGVNCPETLRAADKTMGPGECGMIKEEKRKCVKKMRL
jgi:hypothetical protein